VALPFVGADLPTSQIAHRGAAASEAVPGGHVEHVVPLPADAVPGAHPSQLTLPLVAAKVPPAQLVQVTPSVEKVPARQAPHDAAPTGDE